MHEARPCKPCPRERQRRAKLRGPRATCVLRPAPGRLSSARPYTSSFARQQGKAVAQALTDSFLHEARPCKAVSQEKDSAGQSFVARGPPACFAQPRAASAELALIQAAYMSSCASARTSCVARGRKRLRRAKLRGPRATCMLRPAPGRLS